MRTNNNEANEFYFARHTKAMSLAISFSTVHNKRGTSKTKGTGISGKDVYRGTLKCPGGKCIGSGFVFFLVEHHGIGHEDGLHKDLGSHKSLLVKAVRGVRRGHDLGTLVVKG